MNGNQRLSSMYARPGKPKRPKAYSYIRFSTPEQQRGDSYRRQATMAKEYAEEHDLELDEALKFDDEGVSAFRGANAERGALRLFLDAVHAGVVERGSYLLVESLDRISRAQVRRAYKVFESIIEAGITIVTLADGKVYSEQSLDDSPFDLIFSMLIMMRANDESETKSFRLKKAWVGKRLNIAKRPLTSRCPAWLELKSKEGPFEVIEERADVVRRIFDMAAQGCGQNMIAKTLNAEGVPPFQHGKMWHRSYVVKILGNPAVVGTFTPHELHTTGVKKVRVPLEPVANYYPAVVSADLFQTVQSLKESANPQRGRHAGKAVHNIFGGLARCPRCGSAMTLVNKSKGWRYLVCSKAKTAAGCSYRSVPYGQLENAFLRNWEYILGTCPPSDAEGANLHDEIERLEMEKEGVAATIEVLVDALAASKVRPDAVLLRISELQEEGKRLDESLNRLRRQMAGLSKTLLDHKLAALWEIMEADELDKNAANASLRALVKNIVIDYDSGYMTFHWQHGPETSIMYAWPDETTPREEAEAATPVPHGPSPENPVRKI